MGALPVVYALSDHGQAGVVFEAVAKEHGPGWLYMVDDENSTLGENINPDGYGTRHHPYTAWIGGWFYRVLAGIRLDPRVCGFRHFQLKPACVPGLDWVRAHYESLYGRIESAWSRRGDELTLQVAVPANTTATIYIPTGEIPRITEGDRPAELAQGVRFLGIEAGCAVYHLGAGRFDFKSLLGGDLHGRSKRKRPSQRES